MTTPGTAQDTATATTTGVTNMTRTCAEIAEYAEKIYYDLEFRAAREWKAAEDGRKGVG